MSESLHDKTCVVTGASSGIGQAIAQALAASGARVIGYARRFTQKRLTYLPGPGEIRELQLDITDGVEVTARFAELPRLDVLVNAAGTGYFAWMSETSLQSLRQLLDVHVVGTFLCSREAWRTMQQNPDPARRGHIVTIGSIAATRYLPECGAYTAAKSAQAALMRTLAEEARPSGVRVTHVHAGAVDTPLWDDRADVDRTRMMQPQELAALIVDILARPGVALEEVTILPPTGVL
jgi:NAD(P)-dependent dehydrogenase (short-subunit alcohol dehydrogenase family)